MNIRIGTSGWSYPKGEGSWKSTFYPPGTRNELEYYSRFFNTVEINSSFYRPPSPSVSKGWTEKTPPDFLFSVKLWQKFTHPQMYQAATGEIASISMSDIDTFRRSIDPLAESGKLGILLAQFPPSFKNDAHGQQILKAVNTHFGRYRLAVELRHRSWSDDSATAQILRKNNISWVNIDEPKFATSIATETPLTSDTAYFRFHGRNAADWWQGNVETRYKYFYSEEEINELAERVTKASEPGKMTFAYFNNHWKAFAPHNANDLLRALQLPLVELQVRRLTE